ncbi:MAG: hypothetical protein MUE85_21510 [Microscillaceae bacterium]|jgi:hypothetical protein|nr:hypothetical protein [Microscillaceae bacterium]
MQKSLGLFLILLSFYSGYAQQISDLRAELDKLNRQIIITYNLNTTDNKSDKFEVQLYLSMNGGQSFEKEPLIYVTGNVGKGVSPGNDRKIQWRYLTENPSFTGKNIVFKVIAKLDVDAYEKRLAQLGGADKAFNSLLFPGWGDAKVREGKNYWLVGVVSYSLVGTGLYLHFKAKSNYDSFQNSSNIPQADVYFKNSKDQNRLSRVLLGAGAGIWLVDVVSVWLKGKKNTRELNELRQARKNRTSWHFDWQATPQSAFASLRLKF